MSTKKKVKKGASYEAVNNEDDEEEKYESVEMGGTKNTILKSNVNASFDDKPPSINLDTNAPQLIRAFSEISFKQHESQKRIKNRLKKKKINAREAEDELKKAYKTLAHTFDKQQLSEEFNTSLTDGLTTDQVNRLQSEVGFNELTPPKKDPEWLRFLKCTFGNLMSILLSVGAILALIAYGIDPHTPKDYSSLILGFVLIGVVVITGLFIFYQEGKSSNLMSALSAMKPADITVIRNGKIEKIEPKELVPGDLCNLDMGMLIPADLRVISCSMDLEVDNSSLTGESDPQKRSWKPESSDVIPAESKCLCFFGTLIINGKGVGMVTQTGDSTFMGRTAALASSTEATQTPIQREIHSFVTKIAMMAITVGLLLFLAAMLINPEDWITNVILLIGIVITNVPEELMAVVTVQLTLTAQILFRKNVQVKQLGSVETLGSISVICSDKTGTLTTNCMTVQHIYYDFKPRVCDTIHPLYALDGDFYETETESMHTDSGGDSTDNNVSGAAGGLVLARQVSNMAMEQQTKIPRIVFLKLVRCGALCNNAAFMPGGSEMDPSANATEAAIVKFSSGHITADYRLNLTQYRNLHKKLHEIPFNSKNKWQVSIHELPNKYLIKSDIDNISDKENENKKRAIVQMKGAPERILNLCDKYAVNGEILELNDTIREQLMDGVLELGAKGERVLAFAELVLDENKYNINCNEPQIEEKGYDDNIDENFAKEDCVAINYNDKLFKIDLNLSEIVVKQDEENGASSKGVTFENVKIRNLMERIWKEEDIDLPVASQRIVYSDKGIVDAEDTFGDLGVSRGSLLYLYRGPYIFGGGQAEDINIPFNRKDEGGLCFIGLFAMIDPPRPGVPEAISDCQSAGIKVIMVTGDHPITAKAIAEAVGIINEETKDNTLIYDSNKVNIKELKSNNFDAIVVPGWELQTVLDNESEDPQGVADFWNCVLNCDNVVFARTSPQQKLLIVAAVQERGAIVAVTGDGVNDSPALKKADIGVAMGITGTEVAKEAANMILLDDNFTTIVKGIEQGRIIFDNLKKSIAYSLGKNMPEVIPFIVYLAFGCPIPLTPLLLLAVDLGTDIMPSISLAMESKEFDIMQRKPRDPKKDKLGTMKLICMAEAIFGIFAATGGLYAYFTVLHSYGLLPSHLIDGVDRSNVWSFYGNPQQLRDAYYLWCFDPSVTTKCYYYPNFNDSMIPHIYHNNPFPYYNQYQWYQWQMNTKTYAMNAKDYLRKITNDELTKNMLNGKDSNGNTCCNIQFQNGSLNTKCINEQSNDCVLTYLDWNEFLTKYWAPNNSMNTYNMSILNKFNNEIYISEVFPNRFCEDEDYFHTYMSPQKNQPPPYCDWTNDQFSNGKTKTFRNSVNSFFPMATNTRTEALMRAQTSYLVAIVIMQIANLLTIRTRVASLFQQGMVNTFMNYGILFEVFLIAFLVYLPFMNIVLGSRPLRWVFWTPVFPYFIMVIIYHECRKAIIRRDKKQNQWLTRQTLW